MSVSTPAYRFKVTLIPKAGGYSTSQDITSSIIGIPVTTSTGGDEINSAKIELYSPRGEFLTVDPILAHNDHVRIEIWDGEGNKYDHEYEYSPTEQSLEITEAKGVGKIITLNLEGIEYHTQKVNYIKTIRRESPFEVATDIGNVYNSNRGTDQPTLNGHNSNGLPTHIINNYPYGDSPVNCKDRWQELATSLGAPPENNGVQDFFTLEFDTGGDDFNEINLTMKSLGSTPTNPITITEGTLTTDEEDKTTSFAPAKANRIIGIFNPQTGSLPSGFQRFQGLQLRHQFMPFWSNSIDYIKGEQVRDPTNNSILYPIYEAISNVPAGTALTDRTMWRVISYQSYVGNVQYSQWTDDKATLYASSGTDPTNSTQWGRSIPDFNLVIKTDNFFRVPVDYVANDPDDVPDELLYGGTNFYRGFRVLVINGEGDFGAYNNAVLQHDGTTWRPIYQFEEQHKGSLIIDECLGNSYIFTGTTFQQDFNSHTRDCLHPYTSIQNAPGAIPNTLGMSTNILSGVEIRYDIPSGTAWLLLSALEVAETIPDAVRQAGLSILGALGYVAELVYQYTTMDSSNNPVTTQERANFGIDRNFYRSGVCLRFKFPFPSNTFGGITEDIGALYGGSIATNQEPATFDAENSTYTHDGLRGYNNASSSDLGKGYGIGLFMKIRQSDVVTDMVETVANMNVRCHIRDTADHVMYSDFVVPFNDVWSSQVIPFSSFKPYHALPPKEFVDFFVPPQELEQFDEFQWENIKEIGFTLLTAYDEEGRFDVLGSQVQSITEVLGELFAGRPIEDFVSSLAGRTVRMTVDGLRIVKQLVVTSPPDDEFNQESIIRLPDIVDDASANYFVASEIERLKFPKRNLILDTKLNTSIKYGDSINYKNEETITDSDDGENTIKLAVLRVEHSITPEIGGRTRLYLTKRFV